MQALRKDAELGEGMWPEARAAYVLRTVATTLNDLHQLDIIHRDVITDVLIASIRIVMIGRRTAGAKAALKVISKSSTGWMQGTLK
jgi:tRNA A-37 threonylcarbamoyl transferase component Bud32